MATNLGFNVQTHFPLSRKIFLSFTLLSIFSIYLFRLSFFPLSSLPNASDHTHEPFIITTRTTATGFASSSSSFSEEKRASSDANQAIEPLCDYTNGKWVHDKLGPLYNGTTCDTIKEGQNCIGHGRPDLGYLYWRWKPDHCEIPRFDPKTFLQLLSNKHLAFVGDSMARNQLESLLSMLATVSNPKLVYKKGEENKFRRWRFDSHDVTVSVYWSPFLVKGIEKSVSSGLDHNILYLDVLDERWGDDLGDMDLLVLSIGHWFLHPAVYMENGSVLGCHSCTGLNHSEIGFFEIFRKSIRTTLDTLIERKGSKDRNFNVILATFSPSHFEGRQWDSLDACTQTEPYNAKVLEGMDAEMWKIEIEEMERAKYKTGIKRIKGLRFKTLDVTKLSLLRPDGHPGAYMYPFPFSNGVPKTLHNDCLHWCLPGPVDTWNQIMSEILKRLYPQ